MPIDTPRARHPGFKPGKLTLKAGIVHREGCLPLPVDIVFERDVAVKPRHGIMIYTDVFRRAENATVPAIIVWGPYGKEQHLDDVPGRGGMPKSRLSDYQKFEVADPCY